jgi:hypothetical protein
MDTSEEISRQRHDLVEICFQPPMATIEQVKLSVWQISEVGSRRALWHVAVMRPCFPHYIVALLRASVLAQSKII